MTDPLLAHRAAKISSPSFRHELSAGLSDVVERAEHPRSSGAAVPVARASIREHRNSIQRLADRLDDGRPAGIGGIAAASHLLTDSASLRWIESRPRQLADAIEAAKIGLGC